MKVWERLHLARERGYVTTADSVDGLLENTEHFDMVFDATSAKVHPDNSKKLIAAGKQVINLTPAAIGPFVVPPVSLEQLKKLPGQPKER